jgi:DNA-binding response OmpR family regulator
MRQTLGEGSGQLRRVLVVDDYRDGADALADLLRSDGAEVRVAYDAKGAVEAADALLPEVVFLDLSLGAGDGCQVGREIRERSPVPVRLIAYSGWDRAAERARAAAAGFDEFVVKGAPIESILVQSRIVPPA